MLPCLRAPRSRPSRGRSDGKWPGSATVGGGYFPPPGGTRLCIAKQNSRRPPSSAHAPAAVAALGGAGPGRPPSGDRREGHDGRGQSDKRASPWQPIATTPISSPRTSQLPAIMSSPNSSSSAIVRSRTDPTPGRCRKPTPSGAFSHYGGYRGQIRMDSGPSPTTSAHLNFKRRRNRGR
jgi:hypothetical protein